MIAWRQLFEIEPAFAVLRGDPRFEAFRAKVQAHTAAQRLDLERLRAAGLLPDHGRGARG